MASSLLSALVVGLVLGFAIAATPGPIFFLCLRRALDRGWTPALVAGLGVATVDGLYAALAASGVGAVTTILVGQRRWLALAGGVVLVWLGVRVLLKRPAPTTATPPVSAGSLATDYATTFGLTITNPTTVLSFAAVFAGLGLTASGGWLAATFLVGGVLLGSASWWLILATGAVLLRRRIGPRLLLAINGVSGFAIGALGLLAVLGALR